MAVDSSFRMQASDTAFVEAAALVAAEAVALCEELEPGRTARSRVLRRAHEQLREVARSVATRRADASTAAWALEIAAVALTHARNAQRGREIA